MSNVYFSVLISLPLSGCADYLNHYDTVTLAAGDTQKANMLLQTANPFNPDSANTHIPGNGVRAVDAVNRYRSPKQQGGKDIDCKDVSGPVDVTGGDPNRLDADKDGVGCE